MTDGSNTERELANTLEDDFKYACLRTGSSGSATKRARPDVVVLGPTDYAIECKKRPDGTAHFSVEEIDMLQEFADRARAIPLIVIRPDWRSHQYDQWHVFFRHELHRTPKGFSIRKQDLPGSTLNEVFG